MNHSPPPNSSRAMGRMWGPRLAVAGLVATFLLVFWTRYSPYGIFLGGGARYWVERAAAADDAREARAHLRRVLATPYGVNTAENAVRDLADPDRRIRLWRLLIELARSDNWRMAYTVDLERDLAER